MHWESIFRCDVRKGSNIFKCMDTNYYTPFIKQTVLYNAIVIIIQCLVLNLFYPAKLIKNNNSWQRASVLTSEKQRGRASAAPRE